MTQANPAPGGRPTGEAARHVRAARNLGARLRALVAGDPQAERLLAAQAHELDAALAAEQGPTDEAWHTGYRAGLGHAGVLESWDRQSEQLTIDDAEARE